MIDKQAALYDFFVYSQIFDQEDERNKQAADQEDGAELDELRKSGSGRG